MRRVAAVDSSGSVPLPGSLRKAASAVLFVSFGLLALADPAGASPESAAAVDRVATLKSVISVKPASIRRDRALITRTVKITGRLTPFRSGQRVRVYFFGDGRRLFTRSLPVRRVGGNRGTFKTSIIMKRGSKYAVQARYFGSGGPEPIARAKTVRKSWRVAYRAISGGRCGKMVRGFRRALNRVAVVPGRGSCFRGKMSRAVLAYRKMNGLQRSSRATRSVVKRVFNRRGRYRVRRPGLGNHVEASLGKQVLVFAKGKRPYAIFPISSGKSSTPTIRGTYRFYRKDPGYNASGMYYSSYFIGGYAIHGYHSVPDYPASHGCLRTFIADQPRIYSMTEIGQPIYVFGSGR